MFEQTLDIHQNKNKKQYLISLFDQYIPIFPLTGLRFIETFEQTAYIHQNK
jgi:hypothetical protein